MTIQTFIEKAIESGWKIPKQPHDFNATQHNGKVIDIEVEDYATTFWYTRKDGGGIFARIANDTVFLDPLAWQAVGKVEGWRTWDTDQLTPSGNHVIREGYTLNMHRMIDALAEGKTIEEFLATL